MATGTEKRTGKKRKRTARPAAVSRPAGARKSKTTGVLNRNGSQNTLSLFLAFFVVVIILIAVGFNAVSLNRRLRENRAQMQQLQQEIRTEEQRADDIEEYRRYTETDAYIEEIAREKLGLIYEGETVFKEKK